jgi:aldehyde:ferredoxin oxidoreductase
MEYYGYAGNILHVNLSTGKITKQPLDIDLAHKFIGNMGIGLKLLFDILKPNVDPFSPENPLIFGAGPLVGTLSPSSGRCSINTKFPLPADKNGKKYFISGATMGTRRFGAMMKNAGYDHIIVTGRADKPCYLKVTDKDIEICDARDLWGKNVYETGRILRSRHSGKTGYCGTWVIGRAAENMVRPSLGWADDFGTGGRFLGAIPGSKNLKAIVTLGQKGIKVADKKRFLKLIDDKKKEIYSNPKHLSSEEGISYLALGHPFVKDTMVQLSGCSGGMCACKSVHEVKEGEYKGARFGGSFPLMPAQLQETFQLKDMGAACVLLNVINDSGLCFQTVGLTMIPFVTRMYELGRLTKADMGGLEPKQGDLNYILALIEKIIKREDIGAVMAEGWYPLCEKVGIDFATYPEIGFPHSKGVDFLVDARFWGGWTGRGPGFSPSIGLGSIIHPKTKHTHTATYWSDREVSFEHVKRDGEKMGMTREEIDRVFTENSFDTGRLEKYGGEAEALYNALGICSVAMHWDYNPLRDIPWAAEVYSSLTGFEISPRELLRAGERVYNLEKLINVREGFTRDDDVIPQAYLQNIDTPLKAPEGDRYLTDWFGKRLTRKDLEEILDHYYEERGWDIKKGIPTREKLIELGLEEYAGIVEPLLKS